MTYTDEAMKVWRKAHKAFGGPASDLSYHQLAAAVITAKLAEDKAEIARLREALESAADRLYWASTATTAPGAGDKELLARWSFESRAALEKSNGA